jgi:hypothetical protein
MNAIPSLKIGSILILVSVLPLALCSCATAFSAEYYISYVNKTGHPLDEVSVYSGNKLLGFPVPMVVGGEATQGAITAPIPESAEVRLVENGQKKSVTVNIKDVPKGFRNGTIYFVLNSDGTVAAKALKDDDMAGYAELIKGLRPAGEYRFGFVNQTGHELQAVTVFYNGQKVASGGDVLARKRAHFTYSDPLTNACPAEAELRWNENDAPHAVKVKMENVPKSFDGRIFFVIKADNTVEVHPVRNGDDKTAFEIVK